MKKGIKIILMILGIVALCLIIDFVCIFLFNRPLFAIRDEASYSYKGIFYDIYNCPESIAPQVKLKGDKFYCVVPTMDNVQEEYSSNAIKIIDTSSKNKDFYCAQALDKFYEDDVYEYYFSCMKSDYIIVQYEDGSTETVSDALKKGNITIADLDSYHIHYYKTEKNSYEN